MYPNVLRMCSDTDSHEISFIGETKWWTPDICRLVIAYELSAIFECRTARGKVYEIGFISFPSKMNTRGRENKSKGNCMHYITITRFWPVFHMRFASVEKFDLFRKWRYRTSEIISKKRFCYTSRQNFTQINFPGINFPRIFSDSLIQYSRKIRLSKKVRSCKNKDSISFRF